MSNPQKTERPQQWRAPRPLVISSSVLVIGIALSFVGALFSVTATHSTQQERLRLQLSGVSSEVSSTLNSIQVPLESAERVAQSVNQLSFFRTVASSQVGTDSPFRSLVLFDMSSSRPHRVLTLGEPADLLASSATAQRSILLSLHPSNEVQIVALWRGPVRALGFAEYLGGGTHPRALYGETAVPADSMLTITNTSPLFGLNFAMYLGNSPSRRNLIESTVRTPLRGVVGSLTVPFGSSSVTVISVLQGERVPQLFSGTPLVILLIGTACSLLLGALTQSFSLRRLQSQRHVLHSTRRLHEERSVSQTLQRALLPDEHLDFPGVEIATRYRAGTHDLEVGGDWYDAFAVTDDTVLFAVGDVSGRGVAAATVMSSLRYAIRAYALRGDNPASILDGLGSIVRTERDQCFATVLVMQLTVSTGELVVASAGHLAPIIVDSNGSRLVALHVSPPVGVDSPHAVQSVTVSLERGSLLFAYTDGLVERRGELIDDGLNRLTQQLKGSEISIDHLVDSVMQHMLPGEVSDDVALLAVRILVGGADLTYSRRFSRDAHSIEASRRFLEESLRRSPRATLSEITCDAVLLSVSELATNAIVHAQSAFRVRIDVSQTGTVRLEVTDDGGGIPQPRTSNAKESGGRGLQVLDILASRWGVHTSENPPLTAVWAEFD